MLQSLDTLIAFVVILLTASLIVTILVQMLSSAFALRGKNLGNALALSFQSIDPTIGDKAYALAERILSDPRISDSAIASKKIGNHANPTQDSPWSWWSPLNGLRLANGIRPNEIYDLLKKIGSTAPSGKGQAGAISDASLADLAKQLVEKIGIPHAEVIAAQEKISGLQGLIDKVGPPLKSDIEQALKAADASFKAVAVNITTDVDALTKWFGAAQDRAQQWFQIHTRIFTIICGVLLAFVLQLDTVEIFKFVSTNAAARAALAGSADKLVEKADGILQKNGSLLDRIYDNVKKEIPTVDLSKEARSAATNSSALKKAISDDTAHKVPLDFDVKYDKAEKEAIDAYYKDRRDQMADLTKGVAATGFDLKPTTLGHRWDSEPGDCWDHFWTHFLGMAITAGLLSLGAPYWYNMLKNLTSLRPALTQLIKNESPQPEKK